MYSRLILGVWLMCLLVSHDTMAPSVEAAMPAHRRQARHVRGAATNHHDLSSTRQHISAALNNHNNNRNNNNQNDNSKSTQAVPPQQQLRNPIVSTVALQESVEHESVSSLQNQQVVTELQDKLAQQKVTLSQAQADLEQAKLNTEDAQREAEKQRQSADMARAESGKNAAEYVAAEKERAGLVTEVEEARSLIEQLQTQVASEKVEGEQNKELTDHLNALQGERDDLALTKKRYVNMIKVLKDGSSEIETQLTDCHNRLDPIHQQLVDVERYLSGNQTEFSQSKQTFETTLSDLELKLKHALQEIERFSGGLPSKDRDSIETQLQLRDCLKSQTASASSINDLRIEKEKTNKLTKLGQALRERLFVQEQKAHDCAQREINAHKLLTIEKKVSSGLNDAVQKRVDGENENGGEKSESVVNACDCEMQMMKVRGEFEELEEKLESAKESHEECKVQLAECQEKAQVLQEEHDAAVSAQQEAEKAQQASDREAQRASNAEESIREQLRLMKEQKDENEGVIKNLSEKERVANAQARRAEILYHEYKSKADDPDLFDAIVKKTEWLKNPRLVGVDAAYNKGLHLIGPGLTSTQMALIEMQAMLKTSSEQLTTMVGKPELSPIMSGLLTYGILLIPLLLSLLVVVRLRNALSIEKAALWMTLYNCTFCAFLYCLFLWLKIEPLTALKAHHRSGYDFLQFAVAAGYGIYCVVVVLITFKQVLFSRCSVTLRAIMQCVAPGCVGANYYLVAWVPAMMDTGKEHIEGGTWGVYALIFVFQFMLLTCGSIGFRPSAEAGGSLNKSFILPMNKQKLNEENKKNKARKLETKSKMSDFESGLDSDLDIERAGVLNKNKFRGTYDPPKVVDLGHPELVRRCSVTLSNEGEKTVTGKDELQMSTSLGNKEKSKHRSSSKTELDRSKKKHSSTSTRRKSKGNSSNSTALKIKASSKCKEREEGEQRDTNSELVLHVLGPSEVMDVAAGVAAGVTGNGADAEVEKQD